jgi:lipoprotein-releasing system permease protein
VQPFELFVGLRYTRAKRRNHFISFISLISMLGIALGVAALIVVLSVMNGFQTELRTRILGVAAHIEISGEGDMLSGWPLIAEIAKQHKEVRGAMIRGIVPELEDKVADIGKHLRSGRLADLKPGEFGIVLGADLARNLRVQMGEKVVLITPQGQVTPAGMVPRLKQFTVVGLFRVDHAEFDSGLALIDMKDAQVLYRLDEDVSGVRLKTRNVLEAPRTARELEKAFGTSAYVTDWSQQNANYFRAVQIEKRMMFIILTLIIAVAAFNLVSTLVMVVTDKHPDIAILRTLGASPLSVMKIFVVQGTVIGVIGTLLGVAGGVLLALNIDVVVPLIERLGNFQVLSRDVYYISELPSHLKWGDVGTVAAMSLALAFLETLYPSWRASRVNPAEALRYE